MNFGTQKATFGYTLMLTLINTNALVIAENSSQMTYSLSSDPDNFIHIN